MDFFPDGLPGIMPAEQPNAGAVVTSNSERWKKQREIEDRFFKALAAMK